MAADNPTLSIINLVRAIENRPCLWNYTLPDYSKTNVTEKAWAEVAKVIKDSGVT